MTNTEELRAPAAIGGKAASKGVTPEDNRITNIVQATLQGLVQEQKPKHVYVVKIDNWFSPKWRGFGCKALGALGVTWRKNFPVPPFHPNRVRAEWRFELRADDTYGPHLSAERIHIHQHSENNPKRRMHTLPTPQVWLWYSSNTVRNDRASLMVYLIRGKDDDEAWYVEYTRRRDEWRISKIVGVDRHRYEGMSNESIPPTLPWPGPMRTSEDALVKLCANDDRAALDELSRARAFENPSAALPLCERLVELAPKRAEYWERLGYVLVRLKRLDRAEEILRHTLELDAKRNCAWTHLGRCLELSERNDEAEKAYRKSIELRPHNPQPSGLLGNMLLRLERYKEAEPLLRRATRLEDDKPHPFLWLARLLKAMERHDEAQAPARRALELSSSAKARQRIREEFLA